MKLRHASLAIAIAGLCASPLALAADVFDKSYDEKVTVSANNNLNVDIDKVIGFQFHGL